MLTDILRFCRDHGMPETTFGRLAIKDPNFIPNLRAGRQPRPLTAVKIRNFMHNYKGQYK